MNKMTATTTPDTIDPETLAAIAAIVNQLEAFQEAIVSVIGGGHVEINFTFGDIGALDDSNLRTFDYAEIRYIDECNEVSVKSTAWGASVVGIDGIHVTVDAWEEFDTFGEAIASLRRNRPVENCSIRKK